MLQRLLAWVHRRKAGRRNDSQVFRSAVDRRHVDRVNRDGRPVSKEHLNSHIHNTGGHT